MNYVKLQSDILRDINKKNLGKRAPQYDYALKPCAVWVIVNGQCMVSVPFHLFMLDIDKVFEDRDQVDITKLLKDTQDYKEATDTKMVKTVEIHFGKKEKLRVLKCGNSYYHVNEDYLKYFDFDFYVFMVRGPRDPIFIFECGNPVGVVFPVVFREEDPNE